MSEEGPTDTVQVVEVPIGATGQPEPFVIRLTDIVSQQTSTLQKEEDDRIKLNPLINPDWNDIRTKLIAWAARKFTLPCDFITVQLNPSNPCSDGVSRTIYQYIEFLTGKTIDDHLLTFQAVLPDFVPVYRFENGLIYVGVVTR